MTDQANPLSRYYRQPKIYISLPSGGRYYDAATFTPTQTGEIPVMPMTAKDELAFKTPDAMMNGQATVDVIQSCCPNIKDAWQLVSYDIDTILLALRIATYGETMDINITVPVTNEKLTQTINLPAQLEAIGKLNIKDEVTTEIGLKLHISPLRYKKLTDIQLASYEQQKIYATVSNSALTEAQKSEQFTKSFQKMNDINFDLLVDSISEIHTPDGQSVKDAAQIQNFINNCDAKIVNDIQDKLGEIRMQGQVKPFMMKATEEQIKKGVPATYQVPVSFDNSNFFV
jgi:hypothetical protein